MTTAATVAPHTLAGIGWLVLAMALLTGHDALAKGLLALMAPALLLWWRYLFQLALASAVLLRQPQQFRSTRPGLQVARGLLVIGSSMLAFLALRRLPLAEFTAICCLVPVAVTLLARSVLHEAVTPRRWALVGVGLLGALLVARPGTGTLDGLGMAYAGLVVLGYAVFQILTGVLARHDPPLTIQWYTSLVGAVCTSLALPWVWPDAHLSLPWGRLAGAVLVGTVGQFLMLLAFTRAPASVLAPYLYSAMAFSLLAGWWAFGQTPDTWALAGMVLIAASGVAAALLRR